MSHEAVTISIDQKVLARFPELEVAGFIVDGVQDAASRIDVSSLFEEAKTALAEASVTSDNIATTPPVEEWRLALAACGLRAKKYRSSPEQLARRLLKGKSIQTPLPVVNAYCAISTATLTPLGAYDIARLPQTAITVREADPEQDSFSPLGADADDMPLRQEVVVYTAGHSVLCWGFNCRDSRETCLLPGTSRAVFVGEAVSLGGRKRLAHAMEKLVATLVSSGGMVGSVQRVNSDRPHAVLDVPGAVKVET